MCRVSCNRKLRTIGHLISVEKHTGTFWIHILSFPQVSFIFQACALPGHRTIGHMIRRSIAGPTPVMSRSTLLCNASALGTTAGGSSS